MLLVIVVLSNAIHMDAATPTKAKAQTKSDSVVERPFQKSVSVLPPAFGGNSVERLLLQLAIPPKGEFETTAEYQGRLAQHRSDLYAFVADDRDAFAYDPDQETFRATIYPSATSISSRLDLYTRVFDVHRVKLSETKYPGSNAFGGKAVVTKTRQKQTQIVTDESTYILHFDNDPIRLSFSMARSEARTAKPNLRVMFICSPLAEQYALGKDLDVTGATGTTIVNPTIDSPYDNWLYYIAMRVDLSEIWVFDIKNGKVYGKFTPSGSSIESGSE